MVMAGAGFSVADLGPGRLRQSLGGLSFVWYRLRAPERAAEPIPAGLPLPQIPGLVGFPAQLWNLWPDRAIPGSGAYNPGPWLIRPQPLIAVRIPPIIRAA